MTARFALDESSWIGAARVGPAKVLTDAIEHLVERLDVARGRGEGVVKHADYYASDLGEGLRLFSLLFDSGCPWRLDRDLATQLILALDRTSDFDDSGLTEFDAEFQGEIRFAPGLAWAHNSCREGHHVAILPLPLAHVPAGRVPVAVADTTLDVFFVVRESQHVDFFRAVVSLENANEAQFAMLARSAFPALDWADNVWRGLGHLSRPFVAVRDELVCRLGGLNDHGATCFVESSGDPSQRAKLLSARIGAKTSDENGATKRHPQSRRDRTRRHRGIEKVFWWHVKLQPHVDRIHFLYEESSAGAQEGHIVVGLFKDHCALPN